MFLQQLFCNYFALLQGKRKKEKNENLCVQFMRADETPQCELNAFYFLILSYTVELLLFSFLFFLLFLVRNCTYWKLVKIYMYTN